MINVGKGPFWKHRQTWNKVTTRSRVSIYRTNDPMETIAAIGLKLEQDDRHTHIWKKTLCPVTVLVDSQVSNRCPWATCLDYVKDWNYQLKVVQLVIVD